MKRDPATDQVPFPIKWRHQYDYKRDTEEGNAAATVNTDASMTQQSFTEDADINVIARRFGLDQVPAAPLDPSHFRDTTNDPDLTTILQQQIDAKNNFMELPPKLRRRFHDSPRELWAFVNDPENIEEAIRLGLLTRSADVSDPAVAPPQSTGSPSAPTDATGGSKQERSGGLPKNPPETTPQTSQKGT